MGKKPCCYQQCPPSYLNCTPVPATQCCLPKPPCPSPCNPCPPLCPTPFCTTGSTGPQGATGPGNVYYTPTTGLLTVGSAPAAGSGAGALLFNGLATSTVLGASSISIGYGASTTIANSIVINASGSAYVPVSAGIFVKPITSASNATIVGATTIYRPLYIELDVAGGNSGKVIYDSA